MHSAGAEDIDPSIGRDAEQQVQAASDLDVEELLAAGADVDSLVAAGVLQDGDQNDDFAEDSPNAGESVGGKPMSDEEFNASIAGLIWCTDKRYLTEDAPDKSI